MQFRFNYPEWRINKQLHHFYSVSNNITDIPHLLKTIFYTVLVLKILSECFFGDVN